MHTRARGIPRHYIYIPRFVIQEETVNTLRYADRAKNIKNKPVINMDPLALEIHRLKKENQRLRAQLLEIGITPNEEGSSWGTILIALR